MIPPTQQTLLQQLGRICDLSPDVRFGQMLANLGFLAEDATTRSMWDIEDNELLAVVERHLADLMRRQENVA